MAYFRIPDPPTKLDDPKVTEYFQQFVRSVRVNIQSIFAGAVFTQSNAGTSLVYNNQTPWVVGTGDPNTQVSAPIGSLYTRLDGGASTTLYVKESGTGNTGWIAK